MAIKELFEGHTDNIIAATSLLDQLDDAVFTAEEIGYDNTTSGMTATTTQGAIDELHANKLPISGGTLTGELVAQTNANYTTRQVRNIIISTSDPTSSNGQNGDIWVKYKA